VQRDQETAQAQTAADHLVGLGAHAGLGVERIGDGPGEPAPPGQPTESDASRREGPVHVQAGAAHLREHDQGAGEPAEGALRVRADHQAGRAVRCLRQVHIRSDTASLRGSA